MNKININLEERSYPIYITTDYSDLGKCFDSAKITGKAVLITDSNVDQVQADACMEGLKAYNYPVLKYVIKAGEANKNLDTVRDIYKFLIENRLDRKSTLIALGGGVVGDITGFTAATFYRGINFVQVPTTLLSQADSSVGGKTGVDFEGHKNAIGAFYQPRFVYINVNTLRTLPARELAAGLAEVVKHGIIMDKEFLEYIDYNMAKIYDYNENVLQYLAKVNCSIKGKVVEEDERESDIRAILNFGHTYGHAIESASDFQLLHGECISLGMVAAFKTAQHLSMVNEEDTKTVIKVLRKAGLPVKLEGVDEDRIYREMYSDKKVKNGKLQFILPKKIGEVFQVTLEDESLIKQVIAELKKD